MPVTLYDTKGVELGDSKRSVIRDYKRLMRANMSDEIDRFGAALQANAILPEDF